MAPAEYDCDFLVIGTGAAGLTAAARAAGSGLRVRLIDKEDVVGGTTAVSGGIVWIPANPYAAQLGVEDSVARARAYLLGLSHDLMDPGMIDAFLESGSDLCAWLDASTPTRLHVVEGFPDYHPEHEGGLPGGGRSLESALFSFDELGSWASRVRPRPGANYLLHEIPMGGGNGIVDPDVLAERTAQDKRGVGQALTGSLLKACLDLGVEPELGTRAVTLLREGKRVIGTEVEVTGERDTILARHGVLLATGGFEWDRQLVRSFLRGPMTTPASPSHATGDGLRMAMSVGADLAAMREAWWGPVVQLPVPGTSDTQVWLCNRERTLPRSLMVNAAGRRFVNEAANYNALGGAFHNFDASTFRYPNLPSWLILDQTYIDRYGLFGAKPGSVPEGMFKADTLEELAELAGISAEGLVETVARFNAHAREARDPEFGRGVSAYDAWAGDRAFDGAARTLGEVDVAPYYAVQVESGTLGTKGGPRTDVDGRVLDVFGSVIDGLYAAGNAMAAVTGMTYGGAGGTLGPAMVFAYRVAVAVAERDASE